MSEATMRGRINKALKPLDAVAVENRVYPGTPDVNYVEGWIELKWIRRWPKNCEESPVLIDHFTAQQRVWLSRRKRRGGRIHVLLQVGAEWILLDGQVAADILGRATRPELIAAAEAYWEKGLKEKELIACLQN